MIRPSPAMPGAVFHIICDIVRVKEGSLWLPSAIYSLPVPVLPVSAAAVAAAVIAAAAAAAATAAPAAAAVAAAAAHQDDNENDDPHAAAAAATAAVTTIIAASHKKYLRQLDFRFRSLPVTVHPMTAGKMGALSACWDAKKPGLQRPGQNGLVIPECRCLR